MKCYLLAQKKFMSSSQELSKIDKFTVLIFEDSYVLDKKISEKYTQYIIGYGILSKNHHHRKNISYIKQYKIVTKEHYCITLEHSDKSIICMLDKYLEEQSPINILDLINLSNPIKIKGITKGRGFAGVMKKYNFKGLRATHGVSASHRARGSTGCRNPNRVLKKTKMSGRYGGESRTKMSKIHSIDINKKYIVLNGCIPGSTNSIIKLYTNN